MKRILVVLCVLCLTMFFGCSNIKEEENKDLGTNGSIYSFVEKTHIDEEKFIYTFYHKETKVMYMFYDGHKSGGLTVMLDENGKPLLWKGES